MSAGAATGQSSLIRGDAVRLQSHYPVSAHAILVCKYPIFKRAVSGASSSSLLCLQEEYAREGIDWSYVEFVDNQDCLDLLEGTSSAPGLAVFPLIDEACRLPRATYQASCTSISFF